MNDPDLLDPSAPGSGTGYATDFAAAPAALAHDELECLASLYPLPRIEIASGRGAWVRDAGGRDYLDFVSGIGVNALGHAPPGLARAISRQMRTLGHTSNLYTSAPSRELARSLTRATGYPKVFFFNSGAEGVEAALKFARARARARGLPGRDVLAFRGGFHGRTAFALSATWTPSYREPFEPLMPGIRFADFNDVDGLSAALDPNIAAVIVEPVQGEGGAIPARREFLVALRVRTSALGATLIFDEVQSGMGRCGHLLCAGHYGIEADVTVLSKALGGGIPIAAVLMRDDVASSLKPGMHGCTFGGSPVAATAALFMLSRIDRPAFLSRVRRRGRELGRSLEDLESRHAAIAETRGLGLLRAIELHADAPFDAAALVAAARDRGLLLVRGGERAVRLLPPLTVGRDEIEEAVRRLDRALGSLGSPGGPSS
ncbi:MAG: aminotransferase class III-fold pyridoxal phosphate-dependent enzyme [Candidatus Eisenbacteria bacterium]|nr:aminotransferase class III-fold pyridoxal phosphate-dependent enzyme [Candidatus Eisenbacteria bacterium]